MPSVVAREQGHFDVDGMGRELDWSYVIVLQNVGKLDIVEQCNIGEAESPMRVLAEDKALPRGIGVLMLERTFISLVVRSLVHFG
jgi:hypothetical protein